jgi:hypothetical protein
MKLVNQGTFNKTWILILLYLLLNSIPVISQIKSGETPDKTDNISYKNALGIRAGTSSGPVFKHFINESRAYEFILGVWQNAIGFTAVTEKHASAGLNGVRFYYGAGGHITVESGRYIFKRHDNRNNGYQYRYGKNGVALGLDAIVGIDWKIPMIPIVLSFDFKPLVEINNYGTFYASIDPGLGIKFAF